MQLEIALSFGASLCGCVHEQEKGKEKGGECEGFTFGVMEF